MSDYNNPIINQEYLSRFKGACLDENKFYNFCIEQKKDYFSPFSPNIDVCTALLPYTYAFYWSVYSFTAPDNHLKEIAKEWDNMIDTFSSNPQYYQFLIDSFCSFFPSSSKEHIINCNPVDCNRIFNNAEKIYNIILNCYNNYDSYSIEKWKACYILGNFSLIGFGTESSYENSLNFFSDLENGLKKIATYGKFTAMDGEPPFNPKELNYLEKKDSYFLFSIDNLSKLLKRYLSTITYKTFSFIPLEERKELRKSSWDSILKDTIIELSADKRINTPKATLSDFQTAFDQMIKEWKESSDINRPYEPNHIKANNIREMKEEKLIENYESIKEFLNKHLPFSMETWMVIIPNVIKNLLPPAELLGVYNHSKNKIILYVKAIENDCIKNNIPFGEKLFSVFAHEVFHAFHYSLCYLNKQTWQQSWYQHVEIIKESLARYVEYKYTDNTYIQTDLKNEMMHSPMIVWPYSGALYIINTQTNSQTNPDKKFEEILNLSLNDWDKAYDRLISDS
ncbi:MAG: hypothetical protein K5765_01080 [Clostridia bacterium]|nr:hypothetical protein [Clostridia bacterium]